MKINKDNADCVADKLGLGIDENIKDIVIAFNNLDFETEASCEGHNDRGNSFPWIDFRNDARYLQSILDIFYKNGRPEVFLFIENYASFDRLRSSTSNIEAGREEFKRFICYIEKKEYLNDTNPYLKDLECVKKVFVGKKIVNVFKDYNNKYKIIFEDNSFAVIEVFV